MKLSVISFVCNTQKCLITLYLNRPSKKWEEPTWHRTKYKQSVISEQPGLGNDCTDLTGVTKAYGKILIRS